MLAPHAAMRAQRLTHARGERRRVVQPPSFARVGVSDGAGVWARRDVEDGGEANIVLRHGTGRTASAKRLRPLQEQDSAGRDGPVGGTRNSREWGAARRSGPAARRGRWRGSQRRLAPRDRADGDGEAASPPSRNKTAREGWSRGWAHTHRIVFTQVDTITQPITLALKSQEKSSRRDGRCCDLASGRRGGGRMDASL